MLPLKYVIKRGGLVCPICCSTLLSLGSGSDVIILRGFSRHLNSIQYWMHGQNAFSFIKVEFLTYFKIDSKFKMMSIFVLIYSSSFYMVFARIMLRKEYYKISFVNSKGDL